MSNTRNEEDKNNGFINDERLLAYRGKSSPIEVRIRKFINNTTDILAIAEAADCGYEPTFDNNSDPIYYPYLYSDTDDCE